MIQIDNSMLQDILSCSTRAWVYYVQKKKMREQDEKVSERMKVGQLFHMLFEGVLKREDYHGTLGAFQVGWYYYFKEGVTQEKYTLENLLTIAEVWLQDLNTYFRDYEPVCIEQTLEMPLSENVTFFGRPDAVLRNAHGLWIVDNKTTGWLSEEKKRFWARGSQGMGYWELVRHHFGEEPRGVLWNALEIGKIPPYDGNLNKKCSKHAVKYQECRALHVSKCMVGPVTYTREQLEVWRENAALGGRLLSRLYRIGDVQTIPMQGMYTYPGCSTCPLTDWCWGGRPVHMMDSMMEAYQWPQKETTESL